MWNHWMSDTFCLSGYFFYSILSPLEFFLFSLFMETDRLNMLCNEVDTIAEMNHSIHVNSLFLFSQFIILGLSSFLIEVKCSFEICAIILKWSAQQSWDVSIDFRLPKHEKSTHFFHWCPWYSFVFKCVAERSKIDRTRGFLKENFCPKSSHGMAVMQGTSIKLYYVATENRLLLMFLK